MNPASSSSPDLLLLPAQDVRTLLLVEAVEETDVEQLVLSDRDREQATRAARLEVDASAPDGVPVAAFLLRRARLLLERAGVDGRLDLDAWARGGPGIPLLVWILPALLVGALSATLGPERRVNVLANPVLALVAWNLALVVLRVAWSWRRRGAAGGASARRPAAGAPRLAGRLLDGLEGRLTRDAARRDATLARALPRYLAAWRRAAGALLGARIEAGLHLAAIALVAGAIAGMYQRGIVRLYTATWESTFLSPHQADALLDLLLLPARALGLELPGVDTLEGTSAAVWIHAWAISALVWAVLPRLVLLHLARRRARALEGALPLSIAGPYFRRLLTPVRGERLQVHLLPYSYRPAARLLDALRALAHDVFGARAEVERHEALEYGSELEDVPLGDDGDEQQAWVLLFSLAQSPELEVHGLFVRELAGELAGRADLLVLVDGATYRERLSGLPEAEARLEERRRAWDRVVRDAGLEAAHVDLGAPLDAEGASAVAGHVVPGRPRP